MFAKSRTCPFWICGKSKSVPKRKHEEAPLSFKAFFFVPHLLRAGWSFFALVSLLSWCFLVSRLIRLPLPQCFWLRGRKLRPWSKKNSDQNSDHPRLCISQGKEKLRPWSKFLGRGNSDHGLSLGCFWGGGRQRDSYCWEFPWSILAILNAPNEKYHAAPS